jgi:hypothetical protein
LNRLLIQISANRLSLSTKLEPQTLQAGAGEGTHVKSLAELNKRRKPQGQQALGHAITKGKADTGHQRALPTGAGDRVPLC